MTHFPTGPFTHAIKPEHFGQGILVFVVMLTISLMAITNIREGELDFRRSVVSQQTSELARLVESELTKNIYLANGLAATISSYPEMDERKIMHAMKTLYNNGKHLKNLGLAPGNVLTTLYPIEGNETATNIDYHDMPGQWPDVERAMKTRSTVLAGPITLVQGGMGIVSRTPVYLENGEYWGLISLVLEMQTFLDEFNLVESYPLLKLAMRRIDPETGIEANFYGDPAIFTDNPVITDINFPGNRWEIGATPRNGWYLAPLQQHRLFTPAVIMSIVSSLLWMFFQTGSNIITANESRLRTILNTTGEGIIVVNDVGLICEYNQAAATLFGYSNAEILNESVDKLITNILPGANESQPAYEKQATLLVPGKSRELLGIRKDGSQVTIEINVGKSTIAQQNYFVAVVRDISPRKQAEAKLKLLATTDSLTNALNRRAFLEDGDKIFSMAQRFARPLSVLSIDADKFKQINDSYGHDAGDKVLISIVDTLKGNLRKVDLISRFGGEEFIILLPETNTANALLVAEKIRKALATTAVTTAENCILRFTCSIGVATMSSNTARLQQLLLQADRALYEAKDTGRNKVVLYQNSEEHSQEFNRAPTQMNA